ncbi:MAG TPA: CPBP family intramembrane glutamic endopeptidase [Vicinamibacteria bacterium]
MSSPRWRRILVGPHGLRAGWRLLAFVLVMNVPLTAIQWVVIKFFKVEHVDFVPGPLILAEAISLAFAAAATWVMARWEGRSAARYGVAPRPGAGGLFWEGTLWGILSNGAVIALIAAGGGYTVSGLNVRGAELLTSTALWVLAFLAVSLYEEVYFRGYPLFTLSTGLGFWPAAVLLSLVFGALHFFLKPNESWVDGTTVTLIGLFFCFTIRRTGSIWWAVGWHFSWNWCSMGIFGSPNTANEGRPIPGHLLASTFHGSPYLTGGVMGAEASLWMFPLIAALFWLVHRRYAEARFPVLVVP